MAAGVYVPAFASRLLFFLLPLLSIVIAGCSPTEAVLERFRDPPESPHEGYLHALEDAGLHTTALGIDWVRAANEALHDAPVIELPFREDGYFLPREPGALGYRFIAQRGQRISIELSLDSGAEAQLFTDLFRGGAGEAEVADARGDGSATRERLVRVAAGSTTTGSDRMEYTIRRTGEYTLRIQPELLRGARYRVTIHSGPSMAFPVQDRTSSAILSYFGASRDGGRREHHGVDIFAPRGTPVVAAIEANVRRVGTNNLGGKIIWLRDEVGNQSLYYAHLDSQLVRQGARVMPGDTLGLVGNTGNARTTPPHLHFGIYARGEGPVDPLPYLREARGQPPDVTADPARYGEWGRVLVQGARFRQSPASAATVVEELDQHTPVRIVAGSGEWFRVRLPDGRSGYLAARLTEPLHSPLHRAAMKVPRSIQADPEAGSPVLAVLDSGSDVGVLGEFRGFLYVQPEAGPAGWISRDGL